MKFFKKPWYKKSFLRRSWLGKPIFSFKKRSFTLLELIVVILIFSTLASFVFVAIDVPRTLLRSREARTLLELRQISEALNFYLIDFGEYPGDVSRGLPSGIETYLGPGTWPEAPFTSVAEYDWDSFTGSDGEPVYQISVRFCPLNEPENCEFPDEEWAENFDYNSSYYYCIKGVCRSHPNRPDDHPGYCVNCEE